MIALESQDDGDISGPRFTFGYFDSDPYQLPLFAGVDPYREDRSLAAAECWLIDRWRTRMIGGIESLPYTQEFESIYGDFSNEHGRTIPLLMAAHQADSRLSAL